MSLRLKLLIRLLRLFVKPRLAHMREADEARGHLERSARYMFHTPPLSLFAPTTLPGGRSALWIANRPSRLQARRKVILYFHGGGYVAGSPATYAKMLARLSRLVAIEVLAPAYRLAPEHPFPAAVDDAKIAYNNLITKGYRPQDIILGGDSAGGGLAFSLLSLLCNEGRPPLALFAFSPLTDLRFQSCSFSENAARDALLPSSGAALTRDMYLHGHSPEDPRASPLLADFPAPPPVFLQFSASEILRDDSRHMAAHLRASGGRVTEDEWRDTPHVWVVFDGLVPEARAALERVADFIRKL